MNADDKRFALRVMMIADMVTGLPAQTAAEILGSAVVTVARDRSGSHGERFAEYVVEVIEDGMSDPDCTRVNVDELKPS